MRDYHDANVCGCVMIVSNQKRALKIKCPRELCKSVASLEEKVEKEQPMLDRYVTRKWGGLQGVIKT